MQVLHWNFSSVNSVHKWRVIFEIFIYRGRSRHGEVLCARANVFSLAKRISQQERNDIRQLL